MTQLAATILEALPDPILVFDAEWRFVYINPPAQRTSWIPADQLIGRVLGEVMPEVWLSLGDYYRRAVAERTPVDFEIEARSGRIYHMHAVPFEGGLLVRGHDVTEHERARRDEERRLRLILDRAADEVAVVDAEGRILQVNDAACANLGYLREELLALPLASITGKGNPFPVLKQVLESGPATIDGVQRRKDGSTYPVELRLGVIDDGPPARFVAIARDTTQRKRDEARMRDLAARLRAVTELASGVVGARTRDELRAELVKAMRHVASFDVLTLGLYDAVSDTLTFAGAEDEGIYTAGQIVAVAGTPSERVLRQRRALVTGHADQPEGQGAGLFGSMRRSEATLRVPLLSGGEPVGVLCLQSYTPDRYTAEDVEVAEAMACIAATAVEKIRSLAERDAAEAALRLSEERYRMLVELSPEAIFVQQRERMIFANPAAVRLFGATHADQLLGISVWDTLEPEEHPVVRERIGGMLRLGVPAPLVALGMRTVDGRHLDCEVAAAPAEFDGERAIFVLARDVTARKDAEERLVIQARVLDAAGDAVVATGEGGRILVWNAAAERLFGWSATEVLGRSLHELGVLPATLQRARLDAVEKGGTWSGEAEMRARDGTAIPTLCTAGPILDREGRPAGMVAAHTDLRQRKQLEEELRQAQKMEAVGRLAGGIAHDFNNVLVAIRGYAELALEALPPETPVRADLLEVRRGAERAAELTHQLLAFSRKQILRPRVLDLAGVVGGVQKMLCRLIGEDIDLVVESDPGEALVEADPTQLEQVLLNLTVNSRDAMPGGGRILVRTEPFRIPEDDGCGAGDVPDGDYVRLAVADTGVGMDDQTRAHMFEPFFTTKEQGHGTGLGLAMVYGIVRQSGGHIRVRSQPGRGTCVEIFLPRVGGSPAERPGWAHDADAAAARGTILLVEDEPAVRAFVRRVLQRTGFRILEAADGLEALQVARALQEPIDLLLTDVVMPGASGLELATTLAQERPGLKVLYISGYSEEMLKRSGEPEGAAFLTKPFGRGELLRKIAALLTSSATPGA